MPLILKKMSSLKQWNQCFSGIGAAFHAPVNLKKSLLWEAMARDECCVSVDQRK